MSDAVSVNGYPIIGWTSEYFNTWLAQNSQIISLQMEQEAYNYEHNRSISQTENIFGGLSSIASLNPAQTLAGGSEFAINQEKINMADQNHAYYIFQQMAQVEKQQMLPNTTHQGSSNATLLGYNLLNSNVFTRYSIKSQFAKRIDSYFDMYGYLTNEVKIPNLNNRPNWNYVKTIGINITSDAPQEDIETLKNIYNQGVTIWHNPETFGDYSQNNR